MLINEFVFPVIITIGLSCSFYLGDQVSTQVWLVYISECDFNCSFALIYDQTVLAVGRWLGEGNRLEQLNELRFWFHALCTPLLVIFCWHALVRANIALFQKRKMMGFAWGLTIFLLAIN